MVEAADTQVSLQAQEAGQQVLTGAAVLGLEFAMKNSQLTLLTIFKYLPGCSLYHKIALMDRKTRSLLINSAILDQDIVITQKCINEEAIQRKGS